MEYWKCKWKYQYSVALFWNFFCFFKLSDIAFLVLTFLDFGTKLSAERFDAAEFRPKAASVSFGFGRTLQNCQTEICFGLLFSFSSDYDFGVPTNKRI